MKHYDYIIAGAGCAGLSLLMRLLVDPATAGKRILLVDRAPKDRQDRTWCFWEDEPGFFEPIVYRRWQQLEVYTPAFSKRLSIDPYIYKMIRGIDFYRYCFDRLRQFPNVEELYGEVGAIQQGGGSITVTVSGITYTAGYLFNSIPAPLTPQPGRQYLLQHFRGWLVRTAVPCFDNGAATLMDFRVDQNQGHCFVYVLPVADDQALVECTFFSGSVLPDKAYEDRITSYMATRWPGVAYTILEKEQGVIPMTNHRFPKGDGRVINIGTAGGCTRPSTGYTFQAIQTQAAQLAHELARSGPPGIAAGVPARFRFYDAVLLRVLAANRTPAASIFGPLFRRNSPVPVLRFLDQQSRLGEELAIIATLPVGPFLKAALDEIRKGP